MSIATSTHERLSLLYDERAFTREDESDDRRFYATERMVSHLDSHALQAIERMIGVLVREAQPRVLDLMASWDSHLPEHIAPARMAGLGLNEAELAQNSRLTERVIHDVNQDPRLPFADGSFDVVLNTASVDYMTRPFELFQEVGRVLRPGGLFLVTFSNRMFPQKAVRIWRQTNEDKRVHLVEDFFHDSQMFDETRRFVLKGGPRPADDKYADSGLPADPVYAVFASRLGATRDWPSLERELLQPDEVERRRVERRKAEVRRTMSCPYCEQRLRKWAVPQTPFTEWDNEFLYICFNDQCPYLIRGWSVMARQGNLSCSYRLAYNADRDVFTNMIVRGLRQLREHIVD